MEAAIAAEGAGEMVLGENTDSEARTGRRRTAWEEAQQEGRAEQK